MFAAENIRTGRPVAVKLLRAESKAKSSAVARFRREARAAGSINSDFVTEILDVEEDQEHGIVLVFELLEGESLIDRLKRTGPIPFDELFPIIEQVWIGLADAHKAGIIHRDLKPSNVFLERRHDGSVRVKILDFGISKLPKEMGGETLTEMGQSLGTFSFMPPEQIGKAKTVDHRADIYACATLIYQALSGQLPYAARNILVMVEMKSKTEPRKLSEVMGESVDPRLEEFLATTLARDPNKRYQTALDALEAWRRLRPAGGLGAGAGAGGAPRATPSEPSQVVLNERGLPLVSEPTSDSTSDTAATIAIPVRQLMDGQSAVVGGTHRRAPLPAAGQAAYPAAGAQGPQRTPSGTMLQHAISPAAIEAHASQAGPRNEPSPQPQQQPQGQPQQQPQQRPYDGNEGRFGRTVAIQPQNQGQPYPNPGPPRAAQATPAPPEASPPTQSSGSLPIAHSPSDDTGNAPSSQDMTQVYRPAKHGGARSRPSQERGRSALPFVLGAIAFALVGFGVVAVLLEYVRTGLLPWQH